MRLKSLETSSSSSLSARPIADPPVLPGVPGPNPSVDVCRAAPTAVNNVPVISVPHVGGGADAVKRGGDEPRRGRRRVRHQELLPTFGEGGGGVEGWELPERDEEGEGR